MNADVPDEHEVRAYVFHAPFGPPVITWMRRASVADRERGPTREPQQPRTRKDRSGR